MGYLNVSRYLEGKRGPRFGSIVYLTHRCAAGRPAGFEHIFTGTGKASINTVLTPRSGRWLVCIGSSAHGSAIFTSCSIHAAKCSLSNAKTGSRRRVLRKLSKCHFLPTTRRRDVASRSRPCQSSVLPYRTRSCSSTF